MSEEIHVGDVGTALRTTIYDDTTIVDISSATLTFYFKKPGGTIVSEVGSLVTDGTDGRCQYVSEVGFFDVAGTWNFQVKVVLGDYTWRTNIQEFKVHENIA